MNVCIINLWGYTEILPDFEPSAAHLYPGFFLYPDKRFTLQISFFKGPPGILVIFRREGGREEGVKNGMPKSDFVLLLPPPLRKILDFALPILPSPCVTQGPTPHAASR